MSDFSIWWTSQSDCETIGGALPEYVPEYVREEYRSRLGRAGRGRLWVSDALGAPDDLSVDPWPDKNAENADIAAKLAADYGGIVIRDEDLRILAKLPGITTDMELWRVR